MAINTELLEKVKAHILEEPRRYKQCVVAQASDASPCGTVACIAGWADYLANGTKIADEDGYEIMERARVALGLTEDESDVLFNYAGHWPKPFRSEYYESFDPQDRARVAANYIDHIIASGKVE